MTNYCKTKIRKLCFYGRNSTHRPCSVLRYALHMEKELSKVCKYVWEFTNTQGDKYLFAKYINLNDSSDTTIVTVGSHNRYGAANYIHF